ncbi:pilus assembly PilX N-terminal domain-containing protein [Alkalibacterium olivapovliticus]|uniref:DUF7305 domain-containing protein n=1 Tax=Alkalibacterium olivapovliticus TaxID=99907 RepID=A0A2T0W946_9LACT|nr:pilus assembly PilX N-terminal domain-containing protein [Alkalibacterium olivapovliticus]PRY83230.1 hypothetical protein CLV38_1059 [Alkalibacterium olivapovliticus]
MKHTQIYFFQNEEGSGLILALMTLLVLSVLGASLGAITIGGFRLSSVNRDTTSAYYIAEAGINQTYEEMKSIVLSAYDDSSNQASFFQKIDSTSSSINGKTIDGFSNQFGDSPKAVVSIKVEPGENSNTKTYTLISEGKVDNKNRVVEKMFDVTWVEKTTLGGLPALPANASLIVNSDISFTNGNIIGDIYLKSNQPGSFTISNSGTVTSNSSNIFVPIVNDSIYKSISGDTIIQGFKNRTRVDSVTNDWSAYNKAIENIAVPPISNFSPIENRTVNRDSNRHDVQRNNSVFVNNYLVADYTMDLTKDIYIDTVNISSNYKLNLKTNNKTINIIVKDLNISQGSINITDQGQINFYVTNSITLGGGSTINSGGKLSQMNMFYFGNSKVSLSGSQAINGSLFNDRAELELTASGNITGSIFSRASAPITISGGSSNNILLYAPNATVNAPNGKITGVVLANKFNISGGATIEYKPYELNDFPFLNHSVKEDTSSPEDVIKANPIIERR